MCFINIIMHTFIITSTNQALLPSHTYYFTVSLFTRIILMISLLEKNDKVFTSFRCWALLYSLLLLLCLCAQFLCQSDERVLPPIYHFLCLLLSSPTFERNGRRVGGREKTRTNAQKMHSVTTQQSWPHQRSPSSCPAPCSLSPRS